SLVRYHPAVGVVLNLQRDHKEMDVVADMFRTFRDQVRETLVVGEAPNLQEFHAKGTVFGFGPGASFRAEDLEERPEGCRFSVAGVRFQLSVPGRHNVENALAALAACRAVGVPLEALVTPLASFEGVARRFQPIGVRRGVEVIDDFAHNPSKVAASLRTARARAGRVLAVFQPHGFAPTRFNRKEFVETFSAELGPQDRLWMLDIYYAGGTAAKDICSGDLVDEIAARGAAAELAPSRERLVESLAAEAREGDVVLVMGARDPSLTDLAHAILARLG
ncbi:MAG TPA: cyanophycin synthetase, partial [Holophaga sp.]|nr:cyanophycin synthetase [Holophaga sp.]